MVNQTIRNIDTNIPNCETIINYTFSNKLLCLEALNNSSYPIYFISTIHHMRKNDALAVLGDACMAALLCTKWWINSTAPLKPGNWDTLRKDQLNNAPALAMLGRTIGLGDCIVLNPGQQRDVNGYKATDRMVATAVEAVMGAVYLDGGERALDEVMEGLGLYRHRYL